MACHGRPSTTHKITKRNFKPKHTNTSNLKPNPLSHITKPQIHVSHPKHRNKINQSPINQPVRWSTRTSRTSSRAATSWRRSRSVFSYGCGCCCRCWGMDEWMGGHHSFAGRHELEALKVCPFGCYRCCGWVEGSEGFVCFLRLLSLLWMGG